MIIGHGRDSFVKRADHLEVFSNAPNRLVGRLDMEKGCRRGDSSGGRVFLAEALNLADNSLFLVL